MQMTLSLRDFTTSNVMCLKNKPRSILIKDRNLPVALCLNTSQPSSLARKKKRNHTRRLIKSNALIFSPTIFPPKLSPERYL